MRRIAAVPVVGVLFLAMVGTSPAEETPLPADSGVADVTKAPYDAKGDGKTDDTAAIQAALDVNPKIVYLPNGTYLISETLKYAGAQKRVIFQGQSMGKTIVKLKDACPGYTDAAKPKSMIWTGKAPAQRFRNGIRNITFDAGAGNPGAIGIQYIANNQGAMHDVAIRSQDGKGKIGLDLGYTNEQGPCLIASIHVTGFDVGVSTKYGVDSVVLEHIYLDKQNKSGFVNEGQCLSIRGIHSNNAVPALVHAGGVATLIDSELIGTGEAAKVAAVSGKAALFVRNVKTSGYKTAIDSSAGTQQGAAGPDVDEWVSHEPTSPFGDGKRSLNLPVKETPTIAWGDVAKDWVSVAAFLPKPTSEPAAAKKPAPVDATEAFQKAIDSGKKTVYFPLGAPWLITGTGHVRGKVERIIGLENDFRGKPCTLVIDDGDAPAVLLERFDWLYSPSVHISHASKRTLILSSITGLVYEPAANAGDLFVEDVCATPWGFRKGQNIWMRQLNTEGPKTHIVNDGAVLWILGQKTEGDGALSETLNGGRTEVCGGFAYANTAGPKPFMFKVTDSWLSATLGGSVGRSSPFKSVEETRAGKTESLALKGTAIPLAVCGPPSAAAPQTKP